jgi:hypothetical protein
MPRTRGLASPLPRLPLVPPAPPRPILEPPLVDGAGTRDCRAVEAGVWNLGVGFEEDGFSTNDISVVLSSSMLEAAARYHQPRYTHMNVSPSNSPVCLLELPKNVSIRHLFALAGCSWLPCASCCFSLLNDSAIGPCSRSQSVQSS